MTKIATYDPELLQRGARVPDHVVFRDFAQETVVLNLDTGQYHALNPTGGRMLDAVSQAATLEQAAARLAEQFPAAPDIKGDLCRFCRALANRGLIELTP